MAVITGKSDWPISNQETRMKKGKLITVKNKSGAYVKMYEKDAENAGLIPKKEHAEVENKQRFPVEDKTVSMSKPVDSVPDDFTTIENVGPATARAIVAHGITTFGQLRNAGKLNYISIRAMESIETWRQGNG